MSYGLAEDITYSDFDYQKKSVEVVDADWKGRYGIAVIFKNKNRTAIHLKEVEIKDTAMPFARERGDSVWLFSYTDFPLVEVNPRERTSRSYPIPEILHGSHALCVRGRYAYFFDPYEAKQLMYQLKIGTLEPLLLGTVEGAIRRLDPSETYHFISTSDQEVMLHQVLNEDEYKYS